MLEPLTSIPLNKAAEASLQVGDGDLLYLALVELLNRQRHLANIFLHVAGRRHQVEHGAGSQVHGQGVIWRAERQLLRFTSNKRHRTISLLEKFSSS